MADLELLKSLRAAGVKSARFSDTDATTPVLLEVEFFPRGLLDVSDLVGGEPGDGATERPPPAGHEDDAPNARPVPPALARVMKRGSVS